MKTLYWSVDPKEPEQDIILHAVRLLQHQELVAFPTETVYGVGALAFSPDAVDKIFAAKVRPAQSPLLIHLSNMEQVKMVVDHITGEAARLMEHFWPGPLSLILTAAQGVPPVVRSGTPTVGLRMPSHPVARALIEASGPLAATSANLSGRPSPVNADDVRADLDGRISAVLDAGPTGLGLESTVLDLTVSPYCVLRRGGIPVEELEELLGREIQMAAPLDASIEHYKTTCPVYVSADPEEFQDILMKSLMSAGIVGVVYNDYVPRPVLAPVLAQRIREYHISLQPGAAKSLYSLLREAEAQGLEVLIFAPLPEATGGIATAIVDRIWAAAQSTLGNRY
ncbi:MAG TPA: L-threonylcarbamoyladenylate synthase [Syntrophomonadaceae bacterium]|nr:L-threonylcarbamoyladenylate synthase [Syntrophomonadaceae bacterium]